MQVTGWIKRVLPFVATFAVGVFIASFFVDIGASSDRCKRGKKRHEMQRLRAEIDELRNENLRLRNEKTVCDLYVDPSTGDETFSPRKVPTAPALRHAEEWEGTTLDGLPHPLPAAPMPPPAPKAKK